MQWQSIEQGKAKDAWERKGCTTRATKHYKSDFIKNSEAAYSIITNPSGGESYNNHFIYTGPRGGKYYINANGNKTYIKH